jgi:hypothetical protein
MRTLVWLLAGWLGWKVYKKAQLSYADTQPPQGANIELAPPSPEI